VILAEPPPSQGDLHFSLLGFPVRIHPLFWLAALFLGYSLRDPIFVALWIVAMVLCILLHELGHALVMQSYGYCPSIVLYSFGGLAIPHGGGYDVRRPGPWGNMLIAFAGPASGFILAAVLALGLHYLGGYDVTIFRHSWRDVVPVVDIPNRFLYAFVYFVLEISVMWGLLNLLPIYPLDGSHIAEQILVLTNPRDAIRQSLMLSVLVGGTMTAITFIPALKDAAQMMNRPHGVDFLALISLFFLPMFFFFLTYSNFMTLQSYQGGRF
jgi:Zn-dependent protease